MADPTSLRVLRTAIAAYEKNVLPDLQGDRAQINGGLIHHALKYVERRESELQRASAARVAARQGQSSDVAALVRTAAVSGPSGDAARAQLRMLLGSETAYFSAFDPECIAGSAAGYRGGRSDQATMANDSELLSTESLTRWAHARWPAAANAQVVDLSLMPGGFSKTTAFLTFRDASGDRRVVMRRDLPIPLLGQSVVSEYPLLQKLSAAGFLVAKPLHLEAEPQFAGGAFMLSERLPGSVDFTRWKDNPPAVLAIAGQLAQLLARLHSADPATLGFAPAGLTARDCMERELKRWYALYRSKMLEEQPLLELAFHWLMDHIPADLAARPPRLLHGDAGFHNLLVHEGKVSALLDWEFHHLGDPVEELAYARQFIEQVMDWKEFMQLYTAAGGIEYPIDDRFYAVWTATRNPIGCIDSIALFEGGMPDVLNLAMAGYVFGPRLQLAAASKVLDIVSAEGTK